MTTVLFACVHNAGRSQMAAAFFNQLADPRQATAISAGTQPAPSVHDEVISVMREAGIDLSAQRPRRLTPELASRAQVLITMGCGDACPFVPGINGMTGPSMIRRASRSRTSAGFATRCGNAWKR